MPELDVQRARQWAHEKTPAEYRDERRVEVDVGLRGLTIFECRPPWSEHIGPDWTRAAIARLDYAVKNNEWTLYWPDRNSTFRQYLGVGPTEHLGELLAEIDADPTHIFWG